MVGENQLEKINKPILREKDDGILFSNSFDDEKP